MKLPNHDRISQTFPDTMHTLKDVIVHVFNVITGKEDTESVRRAESAIGRFEISEPPSKRSRGRQKPIVPCYRLSAEDITTANRRALSVVMPSPDFTPGMIFTKTSGMKSHDWKEVRNMFLCVCTCSDGCALFKEQPTLLNCHVFRLKVQYWGIIIPSNPIMRSRVW